MIKTFDRKNQRLRRKMRIRKKLAGTTEVPRLCVYRSVHHIYAQIVDDSKGVTLAAASTVEKALAEPLVAAKKSTKTREAAVVVGKALAERARAKSIERVAFDRGGNLYFGRVRALAEAAREAGLKF